MTKINQMENKQDNPKILKNKYIPMSNGITLSLQAISSSENLNDIAPQFSL